METHAKLNSNVLTSQMIDNEMHCSIIQNKSYRLFDLRAFSSLCHDEVIASTRLRLRDFFRTAGDWFRAQNLTELIRHSGACLFAKIFITLLNKRDKTKINWHKCRMFRRKQRILDTQVSMTFIFVCHFHDMSLTDCLRLACACQWRIVRGAFFPHVREWSWLAFNFLRHFRNSSAFVLDSIRMKFCCSYAYELNKA